mgnify:CR=1 FL=1
MPSGDIGWLGLAASLVLVAVALGVSKWRRLGLERDLLWATGRALVQLTLVGYALGVVIDDDAHVGWAWTWLAAMVPFAAWTVGRRAPEVLRVRVALAAVADDRDRLALDEGKIAVLVVENFHGCSVGGWGDQTRRILSPRPMPLAPVRTVSRMAPRSMASRKASFLPWSPVSSMV